MIIDLCCGIGRFDLFDEDTISIDFDRKVKPTIQADIRYLPLRPKLKPRLLHASPPCKYFSVARYRKYGHDYSGIAESLGIVKAFFEAVSWLEPKQWTLENPVGFLSKLFNETRITYAAYDYSNKRTVLYSSSKSLKRAVIPNAVRRVLTTLE
jgi:site-specific DNA-cytosine methylase